MMARIFVPEVKQLSEEKCRRFGEVVPLVDTELKLGLEPDRLKFLMSRPLATAITYFWMAQMLIAQWLQV